MPKSALLLGGVCLTLAGAFAGVMIIGRGRLTVRIPLAVAQKRVDARLPIESRSIHHAYEITRAKLAFASDGHVLVDCDFTVDVAGRAAAGRLTGRARPVYRDHGFYLEDLEVAHLDLAKLELASDDLERGRRLAGNFEKDPAKLQDHKIIDRAVTLLVGGFLSATPVYQLDETTVKHRLARMMLREIRVESDALVAVLDPTSSS
jgi:hypothetical protein